MAPWDQRNVSSGGTHSNKPCSTQPQPVESALPTGHSAPHVCSDVKALSPVDFINHIMSQFLKPFITKKVIQFTSLLYWKEKIRESNEDIEGF